MVAKSAPGPERTVVVRGSGSGIAQDISVRDHRLVADELAGVGDGADRGPDPYELLLASLGACTAITLRLYAERKGWALEDAEVRLRHRRVHADDCADCETKTGFVDSIEVEVTLHGALDAEQRERLLQIAGRCPVNRTLQSEIKIRERFGAQG